MYLLPRMHVIYIKTEEVNAVKVMTQLLGDT